jgi:hypothetical protein
MDATYSIWATFLDYIVALVQVKRFLDIYSSLAISLISLKYKNTVSLLGFMSKLLIIVHICVSFGLFRQLSCMLSVPGIPKSTGLKVLAGSQKTSLHYMFTACISVAQLCLPLAMEMSFQSIMYRSLSSCSYNF